MLAGVLERQPGASDEVLATLIFGAGAVMTLIPLSKARHENRVDVDGYIRVMQHACSVFLARILSRAKPSAARFVRA
jgi:hypothetical protein